MPDTMKLSPCDSQMHMHKAGASCAPVKAADAKQSADQREHSMPARAGSPSAVGVSLLQSDAVDLPGAALPELGFKKQGQMTRQVAHQ